MGGIKLRFFAFIALIFGGLLGGCFPALAGNNAGASGDIAPIGLQSQARAAIDKLRSPATSGDLTELDLICWNNPSYAAELLKPYAEDQSADIRYDVLSAIAHVPGNDALEMTISYVDDTAESVSYLAASLLFPSRLAEVMQAPFHKQLIACLKTHLIRYPDDVLSILLMAALSNDKAVRDFLKQNIKTRLPDGSHRIYFPTIVNPSWQFQFDMVVCLDFALGTMGDRGARFSFQHELIHGDINSVIVPVLFASRLIGDKQTIEDCLHFIDDRRQTEVCGIVYPGKNNRVCDIAVRLIAHRLQCPVGIPSVDGTMKSIDGKNIDCEVLSGAQLDAAYSTLKRCLETKIIPPFGT